MSTSCRVELPYLMVLFLVLLAGSRGEAYINLGFRSKAEYDRYVDDYVRENRAKIASATAAIDRDPKSAEAWYARGKVWVTLPDFKGDRLPGNLADKWEKAEADFKKAAQLDPKMGKAWIQLGMLGTGAKQREAYRKAVDLDPKAPMPHALLALALTAPAVKDGNDPAKAVEHARKACELTTEKDKRYLQVLAVVCSRAKDFDGAVRAQKKVVALTRGLRDDDVMEKREKEAATAFLELYEKKIDISDLRDAYTPHMDAILMLNRSVRSAP